AGAGESDLKRPGGPRPRGARHRRRDRGRPADRASRGRGDPRAAHGLDAGSPARGDPLTAAGLPHRPPARTEHRPAAQPGEDRHRGVTSVGVDLLDIERLERALERRPRLAERLFTDSERLYAAARARPGQHLAARFCAKEAVAKALGLEAWSFGDVEVLQADAGGRPEVRLSGTAAAR